MAKKAAFNRLSADYWEEVEDQANLICLEALEFLKKHMLEGGRMFGTVKLSPEMQALKAAADMAQAAIPTEVPPPEGMPTGV